MSASISDPFVLSTYDLSDRFAQSEGPSHVYVTHQTAVGGREGEGYAAVTAQRDGIHVLDVRHTGFICAKNRAETETDILSLLSV